MPKDLPGKYQDEWRRPWTRRARGNRGFRRWLRRNGYLSPNFRKAEFASKPGCGCPSGLPLINSRRAQKLCFKLEVVRHAIGDKPIGLLSSDRNPCKNDCVNGATASRHMQGDAVDPINSAGVPWSTWNAAFERVFAKGGIGRGCNTGNVQHVDLGAQRRWCYAGR